MKRAREVDSPALPFTYHYNQQPVLNMPLEVALKIFTSMTFQDLRAAAFVNKNWFNFITSDDFGNKILEREKLTKKHEIWIKTYWFSLQTMCLFMDYSASMNTHLHSMEQAVKKLAAEVLENGMKLKLGIFADTCFILPCTSILSVDNFFKDKNTNITKHNIAFTNSNAIPLLKEVNRTIKKEKGLKYECHIYTDCEFEKQPNLQSYIKDNLLKLKNLSINIHQIGTTSYDLEWLKKLESTENSNLRFSKLS